MLPDLRQPRIRELSESELPRRHWRGDDGDGGVWLFESVEGDGEHWAIRQIEIDARRGVHLYWWRHLQDEHGFLTDQALEIWDLTEIGEAAFQAVWAAGEEPGE
ncbi:hypothetical protein LDL08_25810 [Nonomuraea glycinis]|uniref:Uncharacterized protein n=2 Tax=Nonomuraea glycinis TaxID=2047744 RepID=A0A918AFR9_9ACTN|nr:hypothetical protein [Nonomuraea glycinis]MCA2179607.1 hypothetical protein [Nonomuraea glycinis]GGP15321.1 hypothetical protein GCM10012278_74600 [Nonomuraea glycinis]